MGEERVARKRAASRGVGRRRGVRTDPLREDRGERDVELQEDVLLGLVLRARLIIRCCGLEEERRPYYLERQEVQVEDVPNADDDEVANAAKTPVRTDDLMTDDREKLRTPKEESQGCQRRCVCGGMSAEPRGSAESSRRTRTRT